MSFKEEVVLKVAEYPSLSGFPQILKKLACLLSDLLTSSFQATKLIDVSIEDMPLVTAIALASNIPFLWQHPDPEKGLNSIYIKGILENDDKIVMVSTKSNYQFIESYASTIERRAKHRKTNVKVIGWLTIFGNRELKHTWRVKLKHAALWWKD